MCFSEDLISNSIEAGSGVGRDVAKNNRNFIESNVVKGGTEVN